jgi:hypothetical protein
LRIGLGLVALFHEAGASQASPAADEGEAGALAGELGACAEVAADVVC